MEGFDCNFPIDTVTTSVHPFVGVTKIICKKIEGSWMFL